MGMYVHARAAALRSAAQEPQDCSKPEPNNTSASVLSAVMVNGNRTPWLTFGSHDDATSGTHARNFLI